MSATTTRSTGEPMIGDLASRIEPGDTLETVMLSPCVGGLVRTWSDQESKLWSVADAPSLLSSMGRGVLARTLREDRRFREVALLHRPSGTLLLQPRFPTATSEGTLESTVPALQLIEPSAPTSSPWLDLEELLGQAVHHTVDVDGVLLVELGGWDAPLEPYCLFLVTHDEGQMSVVEAAPAPLGAELWQQHVQPGAAGATMSAPATEQTLAVVPTLIIDACATWGLQPWDLAITYGERS
jgi:hypothetical protein